MARREFSEVKIGLLLVSIGVIMVLYSFITYKKSQRRLSPLKEKDLVSYYLDLALELFPGPTWSAILGILLFISGLIITVVSLIFS